MKRRWSPAWVRSGDKFKIVIKVKKSLMRLFYSFNDTAMGFILTFFYIVDSYQQDFTSVICQCLCIFSILNLLYGGVCCFVIF